MPVFIPKSNTRLFCILILSRLILKQGSIIYGTIKEKAEKIKMQISGGSIIIRVVMMSV
jgi:hypothetical protein